MLRGGSFIRSAAVTLLAAVIVFGVAPAAFGERTIALSTGTVELALAPGGAAAETIVVANNGDEPLKALVYTNDVTYDAAGAPTYVKPTGAPGEFNRSPASWITLRMPAETQVIANTPYIELDPGEEMRIDFEMKVPNGATPGDYNTIIFFEMFETETASGTSSQISGRIGSRVVLRVAGDVVDRLEIAPFSVRGLVIGKVVPYGFTVTNEGNIDKRMMTSVVVLDGSENERMRSVVESEAIVYAGSTREYTAGLELQGVSFGKYTLRAELAYDKETGTAPGATVPDRIFKDRSFWVVPLWLVLLLIAAIGAPALWFSWKASAGAAARKHRDVSVEGRPDGADEDPAPSVADRDVHQAAVREPKRARAAVRPNGRSSARDSEERAAIRQAARERLEHIDDEPLERPARLDGEPSASKGEGAGPRDWADDL